LTLTQCIKEKAYHLGFDLIGIAPATEALHAQAYYRWITNDYHAKMQWLARNPHRRIDPRQVVEGAQSVVVVGLSYFTINPPMELWNDPTRGRIARYAWGIDYHKVMLPRLRELGEFIDHEVGSVCNQRSYVDTGPILEREFAAQAGIGFIGKNTLLINPRWGSYLFLGEILLDKELVYDSPAEAKGAKLQFSSDTYRNSDRSRKVAKASKTASCGICTRCLQTCPTHAFPAPYILDSNRCISYLTIELKEAIPIELRPLIGNWIYGCDACQEICPWVRRYAQPNRSPFLHYDPDIAIPKLVDLLVLDNNGFRQRFKGTPMKRTKRQGMLRNVAVALGNCGNPDALPALEQALQDEEPLIREHAAWAINQIKQ